MSLVCMCVCMLDKIATELKNNIATHWLSLFTVSRDYSLAVLMDFLHNRLSFCGAQVLGTVGLGSCSTWVQQFQLIGSRVLAQ